MKRILCLLCALVFLLSCLVIPAHAENNTLIAYRGTPAIDGVRDTGYTSSANFYLGLDPNYIKINCENGGENIPAVTRGDCYVLWDNEYLYFYCTAYDTDIQAGDAVGLFFQDGGSVWCLQYYPAMQMLERPSAVSASCLDFNSTKAVSRRDTAGGYYAVEFALRYYDLADARDILFHYSVLNTKNSAKNESTSGVFFNDRIRLNTKEVMPVRSRRAQSALSPMIKVNGQYFGVSPKTTVSDFYTYYKTDVDVYSASGKKLLPTDFVPNGAIVCDRGYLDGNYDEIIIHGDINKTGKIESGDYQALRRNILRLTDPSERTAGSATFVACDLNNNGRIDSGDYLLMRMYILRIIKNIIPEIPEEVDPYKPAVFSQHQWCGEVKTDYGDHVLAVTTSASADIFGGAQSTQLGSKPLNSFNGGSYENGNVLNISDPMYLQMFENCLYDYTYQAIIIAVPKSTSETSKQYLAAITEMLRLIREYQPTTHVCFLNIFANNMVYEKAGALVQNAGGVYLDRPGRSSASVQSELINFVNELPVKLRTSKPEGALATSALPNVREGMYWIIYDVQDPCRTSNKKRILLVGDSITFGYYQTVRESLKSEYLVDVVGISLAPSDTNAILRSLNVVLEKYDYEAIHFNIGIHNSPYDNAGQNYATYLNTILTGIQTKEPNADLVFATSTPLTRSTVANDFDTTANKTLQSRNTMAKTVCAKLGIPVHDLYTEIINNPQPKADTHHYSSQTQLSRWVIAALREAMK